MPFTEGIKLREFPPDFPMSHLHPSHHGQGPSCLQLDQHKATAQSFGSTFRSSPAQHPASSACVSGCRPLLCCRVQAPAWSLVWSPHAMGHVVAGA